MPLEDACQGDAPLESSQRDADITTKHTQNCNELVNTSYASEATEIQTISRYLHENVILLGSKPTLQCQKYIGSSSSNSLKKEPKLILKNVNSFLNTCKRYCKECLILFPKANVYNLHLINKHTKSNKQKAFMGSQVGNKLYKCKACNRFLSSQNSLLRHFSNFHGNIKAPKAVDRFDKIVANEASERKVIKELSCFHCQQLFPTPSSLIEHLYKVLEPKKIEPLNRSKSSTNGEESNKEVNLNNGLNQGECVKQMGESNLKHKNTLVANSRSLSHSKVEEHSDDAEGNLPQKNNWRRLSDNVPGLSDCGDEYIPKKKLKTNCSLLQNVVTKPKKKLKTKECNECMKRFHSKKELEYHIKTIHMERSSNKNEIKSNAGKEISDLGNSKKLPHSVFYKCFICSKYNVTFEFYSRHIINDHNIKEVTEVKKVPFDSQCKFCPSKTSGIKSYNVHLFKYHKKQLKIPYLPCKEQQNHENVNKKVLFALKNILFKCMKCDLFFLSANAAMDHSKHLGISDTWKCSVCQRIFRRENKMLHEKQHSFSQSLVVHSVSESEFSQALYKCSNCTVHFNEENFLLHFQKCISEAPNSSYCNICDILVNRDDMECHEINHEENEMQCCDFIIIESDMIDDRDITPNTAKTKNDKSDLIHDKPASPNTVKTKINKFDTIHDSHISTNTDKTKSDKSDMTHDRHISTITAETKSDKSDIIHDRHLITNTAETNSDKFGMTDDRHESTNIANTESFNSIKLRDRHVSSNIAKTKNDIMKKTRHGVESLKNSSKFAMSFCDTCKCFLGNVNLRKLHIDGQCGHMAKYICKDCGLMLTAKILATHKEYHKKQQISLHDYVFYDLKSEKRICPPIPDYPKCNSCGVHFLRNHDLRLHSCQTQDYITCNVCSIKLTEDAYNVHVHFHSYSIPSVNAKLKETTRHANPADGIPYMSHKPAEPKSSDSDDAYIINAMTFYKCKSCRLTVNTYDKVVQHCQNHYDSNVVQLNMQKCQKCRLILHGSDYEQHSMLHSNGKYNKDSITIVDYDPFYFRHDNDFWIKHIFAYVEDEDINKILRNSIYQYECRLKMEKIQSGSSYSVLYRCDKCKVFIDPQYLYMHAKYSGEQSCVRLRKHTCALCGFSFSSLVYRMAHKKEHGCGIEINSQSYKIVLYNKEEHDTYNNTMYDANNRYILYQCRNCEGVVEKFERNAHECNGNNLKICSTCGLLLDKQNFDLHSTRHEELDNFNVENIIVVLFGTAKLGKKKLKSTFTGTKYDYTMYKCKDCHLCFRTNECVSDHVCVFGTSKYKCSKCGLSFSKTDFNSHHKVHETNLDDYLSINLIVFDTSSPILHVDSREKMEENNDIVNLTDEVAENISVNPEKQDIIYKCDCGLHFLEEQNARQHTNACNVRMKISKQTCIKCDLLFTPGELFNHLLKHHYDKKLQFKFKVVFVSKNK